MAVKKNKETPNKNWNDIVEKKPSVWKMIMQKWMWGKVGQRCGKKKSSKIFLSFWNDVLMITKYGKIWREKNQNDQQGAK